MASITPTSDVIESILNAIEYKIKVKSYLDNFDGTITAYVCETMHARPFSTIKIDGDDYHVVDVDNGLSVTFKGLLPSTNEIVLDRPFFFHGTPQMINLALSQEQSYLSKYPMVYLLEIMRESWTNDKKSAIDRISYLSLFFLDEANYADWDTDKHYSDVINPMRNMAQAFIDAVNRSGNVGDFIKFTTINHANFGIYVNNQGHRKTIFSDNLSGVELIIDLPILKSATCVC